jgi:hypothetical protein
MYNRPQENDRSTKIRLVATETGETETVRLKRPTFDLEIGDTVELRIMDEGEGDAPTEVRRSSESSSNLFLNAALTKELLKVVSDFEDRIGELISKSEKTEPAEEYKKFTVAACHVADELAEKFLYPVYRRHQELIPDLLKSQIL